MNTTTNTPSALKQPPVIYGGMRLDYFKPDADRPSIGDSEFMNVIVAVCNAVLNCKQFKISERGIIVDITPGTGGGSSIKGEWSSTTAYAKDDIVFFQPDGSPAAGTFYALAAVPAGMSPDTGPQFWSDFPNGPQGTFQ